MKRVLSLTIVAILGMTVTFGLTAYSRFRDPTPLPLTLTQFEQMLRRGDVDNIVWVKNKDIAEVALNQQGLSSVLYRGELAYNGDLSSSHRPHYALELTDREPFPLLLEKIFAQLSSDKRVGYSIEVRGSIASLIGKWFSFLSVLLFVALAPAMFLYLRYKRTAYKPRDVYEERSNQLLQDKPSRNPSSVTGFPVKLANKTIIKCYDEISCFFAQNNCVYLYDREGQEMLVDTTLAYLEASLPLQFLRVHRSSIINTNHILEMTKQPGSRFSIQLRDKNKKVVTSGQSYASRVKELLAV